MLLSIKQKQRETRFINLDDLDSLHISGGPYTALWIQGHKVIKEGENESLRWKDQQIYLPATITLSLVEKGDAEDPISKNNVKIDEIKKKLEDSFKKIDEIEKNFENNTEISSPPPVEKMKVALNGEEVFSIESWQIQFDVNCSKDNICKLIAWSADDECKPVDTYTGNLNDGEFTIKFSS